MEITKDVDADRSKNAVVDVSGRINVVPDRNPEQLVQHRHRIAVRRDRLTVFRTMTGTEIETVGEIADVMIKQKKRGRLAVKPGALSNTFLVGFYFFPKLIIKIVAFFAEIGKGFQVCILG